MHINLNLIARRGSVEPDPPSPSVPIDPHGHTPRPFPPRRSALPRQTLVVAAKPSRHKGHVCLNPGFGVVRFILLRLSKALHSWCLATQVIDEAIENSPMSLSSCQRPSNIPQNIESGDWGVYAIKHIEFDKCTFFLW
ncbi:hypothetical protein F8388_027075 [Cannabis sativa]|uniref:Uncharacterized protein n=1 Tax=Cannabis sativa TaxID=3483 RepID=A0A7J6GZK5_CANSA|nr:hypothetical protein F8388_027075 [Cannabis sativa]KAF4387790.1 hypothetical protein G4B88_004117 [Cannabis sativa]